MVVIPQLIPFIPLIASGVGAAASLYSGYKADQRNQQVQQQQQQTQDKQMGLFDQANALIPGMQGISNLYGQAGQGFLGDRNQLQYLQGQYDPLMQQMGRLYNQDPTAQGRGYMQNLLTDPNGAASLMMNLARNGASDGGAANALMGNAQGVLSATDPSHYFAQAREAGNEAMGQLAAQMAGRGILSSGTTSRIGAATLAKLYSEAGARANQDRLNAYGISNNAYGQAGGLNLQRAGQQASLLGQAGNMQAGLAQGLASLGLQGQGQQLGILGQIGNLLGAQQGNVLQQSGLLGNYLQGLQGQYGMQQGIGNMYTDQAGLLGGLYKQQGQNINPNPYGGFGAALGSFGNAGANYLNWQQKQPTSGVPSTGQSWAGVQYQPAVMPRHYNPYLD